MSPVPPHSLGSSSTIFCTGCQDNKTSAGGVCPRYTIAIKGQRHNRNTMHHEPAGMGLGQIRKSTYASSREVPPSPCDTGTSRSPGTASEPRHNPFDSYRSSSGPGLPRRDWTTIPRPGYPTPGLGLQDEHFSTLQYTPVDLGEPARKRRQSQLQHSKGYQNQLPGTCLKTYIHARKDTYTQTHILHAGLSWALFCSTRDVTFSYTWIEAAAARVGLLASELPSARQSKRKVDMRRHAIELGCATNRS